jgi:hypothetical protein
VTGYYRKDGTYVAPYDGSAPATASTSTSSTGAVSASHPCRKNYLADGYALHSSVQRDRHGRIKRNKAAKAAFERESSCPSTGKTSGRCPGYVVDHVNPLECGGADAPSNMQWQTIADGKAKEKTERECRQCLTNSMPATEGYPPATAQRHRKSWGKSPPMCDKQKALRDPDSTA